MSTQLTVVKEVCQTIGSPEMRDRLKQSMPPDEDVDRFTRILIVALQQNPDIASKDKRSLYLAIERAASDGLVPDGREAALVAFGDKVQYMPMVWGITKKLAKEKIAITAECVFANDEFEQSLGDDAGIRHKAPRLGQDRGKLVGVYAIARDRESGRIIDREVMDEAQVETVRSASRAKNGDLWTKWVTEAYRKTVIRRLSKRLHGLPDAVRKVIEAEDGEVELDAPPAPARAQESNGPRILDVIVGADPGAERPPNATPTAAADAPAVQAQATSDDPKGLF